MDCLVIMLKNIRASVFFRAVTRSVTGMMATSHSRDFFPYVKAILGAGVLIGILYLIGQLGANFRS
ncbi:MAG TPA: hypothetical protein VI338_06610 [Nitrososphaera sp.]|nr:hypothetical protein [Nitrososphaera sp.]